MRRSKEDAEQTRSAILDAAEHLFCAQGVTASTLEGIARKAGVTRGAVYGISRIRWICCAPCMTAA